MDKVKDLILALFDKDAVKFGSFTLKSGIQSPIYFDLRVIISHPEIMSTISEILEQVVRKQTEVDVICGVPYTALPLATIVSVRQNIPMIIKRKEKKEYGTLKLIEGKYTQGKTRCLILEDVITTGSSIIDTAVALRDEGIIVNHAIVILNRNSPVADAHLEKNGIKLESIIKVNQLLQVLLDGSRITQAQKFEVETFLANGQSIPPSVILSSQAGGNDKGSVAINTNGSAQSESEAKNHGLSAKAQLLVSIMEKKQSNLCLSADLEDWQQVLKVTEAVGREICAVKTHVDAINFKDWNEIQQFKLEMTRLAREHNFVVIEDRKFADIGSTVEKQLTAQPFSISDWAQLVTVHAVPGPGMLKVFQKLQLGVILIAEMSSKGNIPSVLPEYKAKALEMCTGYENTVVGFVSQSRVGQGSMKSKQAERGAQSYLQFTPGVSLNATGDALGQQYVSVEKAILERDADVIIVGRGIVQQNQDKWLEIAQEYRKQGWNAFQQKKNNKN